MTYGKLQLSPKGNKFLICGYVVGDPKEQSGNSDVVRNPLDEVGGVLVLDVEHLLVNLLHGHAAAEHGGNGEVAPVTFRPSVDCQKLTSKRI